MNSLQQHVNAKKRQPMVVDASSPVRVAPPNGGWNLFQPDSLLCGAMSGLGLAMPPSTSQAQVPSSPVAYSYQISTGDLLTGVTAACARVDPRGPTCGSGGSNSDGGEDAMQFEMVRKSLEKSPQKQYHFQPHLCEDREFFVINGSTSIDVESLSMGDFHTSYSASSSSSSSGVHDNHNKKRSPLRRMKKHKRQLLSSPQHSTGTRREGAPPPSSPSSDLNSILDDTPFQYGSLQKRKEKLRQEEATIPSRDQVVPSMNQSYPVRTHQPHKEMSPNKSLNSQKKPIMVTPAVSEPQRNEEEEEEYVKPVIDEQRLRELIAPISPERKPEKENQIAATANFLKEMQALVPSCLGSTNNNTTDEPTPTPSSLPGSTVDELLKTDQYLSNAQFNDESGEMMMEKEYMKNFWRERFAEAATKVIRQSSVRCMEIIDPTIPRANDSLGRSVSAPHHHHHLTGRQRYRQVLKRYRRHRILVLIMDPSTKLYEMLELPYRPDETTVADVLIMARIQTTDDRLRYQEYVGLCRPNLEPPPPPPQQQQQQQQQQKSSLPPPKTPPQTPPRHPLLPPKVNRVTHHNAQPRGNVGDQRLVRFNNILEGREDDVHSMASEQTTNTRNHIPAVGSTISSSSSCLLHEITVPEDLVWNLLSPTTGLSGASSCASSLPSELTLALPYFTLPLLGDIVVTIPKGYTGQEVSRYALTILQTPLFLRWIQRRYLNDLQRDNDELVSRAGAAVGSTSTTNSMDSSNNDQHIPSSSGDMYHHSHQQHHCMAVLRSHN